MSNQQYPEINVVIANYNYGQWVIEAIDSAINQDYPNISVSVVDDMSTDNSKDLIINTYYKGKQVDYINGFKSVVALNKFNNPVRIFFKQLDKNAGPSAARNEAISLSIDRVAAFAILDADDVMKQNKVSRLFTEMKSFMNIVGVVYGDYDVLNVNTKLYIREFKESYSFDKLLNRCIVHSGSLVSSTALKTAKDEYGFYDIRIKGPEDWDLWLKIAKHFLIIHVPESLTIVRYTGNNISCPNNPEFSQNYQNGYSILRQKHAVE